MATGPTASSRTVSFLICGNFDRQRESRCGLPYQYSLFCGSSVPCGLPGSFLTACRKRLQHMHEQRRREELENGPGSEPVCSDDGWRSDRSTGTPVRAGDHIRHRGDLALRSRHSYVEQGDARATGGERPRSDANKRERHHSLVATQIGMGRFMLTDLSELKEVGY